MITKRFIPLLLTITTTLLASLALIGNANEGKEQQETQIAANPQVLIETNMGSIKVALYSKKTPITVTNFLSYVDDGFYAETVFHRVIPDFMIQGGGFQQGMIQKAVKAPIKNEAQSFIPNKRGSISMARTNDPDSATAQFFINLKNNSFLNKSGAQAGYAVFGEVTEGMDIVDKIASVQTGRKGPYGDVPTEDIVIIKVSRL